MRHRARPTSRRSAFPVRFYLIAMIFVVFDIEIIFLFPWAVDLQRARPLRPGRDHRLRRPVFVSFVYLVANGALDWGPIKRVRPVEPDPAANLVLDRPARRAVERRGGVGGAGAAVGLEDLSHNFLTGSLEELVKWARRSSCGRRPSAWRAARSR